jgi:hypothetical protein
MRLPPQEVELLDPPLQSKVTRFKANAAKVGLIKMLAEYQTLRSPVHAPAAVPDSTVTSLSAAQSLGSGEGPPATAGTSDGGGSDASSEGSVS